MPQSNPGRESTNAVRRRARPRPATPDQQDRARAARPQPTPDQADRGRPPSTRPTGVFARPRPATAPLQAGQRQAQRRVDTARRRLPAPALAEPPIVRARQGGGGEPLTPEQIKAFLVSQDQRTKAARTQIVGSIKKQLGATRGRERVEMADRLVREIATDPRLERTRHAIRHYTALERETARPQTSDTVRPGPEPRRVSGPGGFASVNLTATGRAITGAAKAATPGLQAATAEGRFARNALKDVAHLPLMVPQTMYEVAAAAKEAAGGDPARAKALAKGFLEGVYGNAIRGDWEGLEDYVREHPVYAVLELRGGKGVVGRGAGAAMRSGALGEGARRAASTSRPDIPLAGGARVADRQHYSPDVITKAFQVLNERRRGGAGKTVLGDHRLRRRADFESDTAAATSRAVRGDEARQAKRDKPKGPLAEVVGLAVQGVVRAKTLEADLRKELKRLDDAHATAEFSTGAQRRQNRANADAIRKVLDSPAAMARIGEVAQSGRANVRAINDLERQAVDLGSLTPGRAERAKLFPAAQAHLDARYGDAPFKAARGREVAAGRALREERTRLAQRVAQARQTEQDAQARVKTIATQHKSERAKESHNTPIAAYYVGAQRFLLRHEAIAAAKVAGVKPRDIRRVALTTGEAKRVGAISQARRAAQSATRHRRAAEADLRALNRRGKAAVPARKAFEAARAERQAAAQGGTSSLHVLDVAGNPVQLPNTVIRAALRGEDVAHLPHHTKARGAGAYYQTQFAGRKNLDSSQKRTGAAFEKGADDRSYQAVTEHRIRMRGVVNRIAEHDRIIHSISITGPKTPQNPAGMLTWDQAEKLASNAADRGAKLVPYRAVPGSYDRARLDGIAARQGAAETPDLAKLVEHEFAQRLKEPAAGDRTARNVVLIPEQIANQLKQQQAVSSTAGKAGNVVADVFRRTVLPFSVKWLTGNIVEAGVRLGAVGAGPNAYRIGRSLLREIDKLDREQAIRVRAALTGGLLYGNRGLTVQRVSEHFEGTALATPAKAVSVAGHLPVVRQLGQAIKGYTDGVFTLNRWIESSAQTAALGKHAKRELQELTGSWAKATRAQEKALQDVARGMLDSKNVHAAAKYIDETLGQYSRFSPPMRRFIQSAAPFLPWYLNSVRWVFWVLPAKHPIKTGLMANLAATLQADFDASHQGLPPGDLRGEVVQDDGTVRPVARFMPFGAFGTLLGGGDEQLTALIDPLFPQFKSAALAAFGMNFSGHQAKIAPEDRSGRGVPGAVRASMAFNSLLEAFVPGVSVAKRVREGGSTGWDNSTLWDPEVKPGTRVAGGAANRILNPFRASPIKAGGERTERVINSPAAAGGGSLLERAAERAAAEGGLSQRQLELLELAAARSGGG